jgi:hypothetical protein
MSAPIFLLAACLVAAAIAAAHLVVMREPPGEQLPTARFVPSGASIVRMLTTVPTDRWLLATRVAAVLLIGLAFARPHLPHRRVPLITIVAVDRSRAVRDIREAAESARAVLNTATRSADSAAARATSVLIPFDTSAAVVTGPHVGDTLSRLRRSDASGSLTTALVRALRVASGRRNDADSIALALVSPVRADEVDAALEPVRALWPGPVRLVRIGEQSPMTAHSIQPTLDWPADGHVAGASQRSVADTVGALVVGDVVVVRPFVRRWLPDTSGARVIGRWVDGLPAAVERPTPAGCTREVAAPIDTGGSLAGDPDLAHLIRTLHEPCNESVGRETRTSAVDPLSPENGAVGVPSAAFQSMPIKSNALSVALLVGAVIMLGFETWMRARPGAPRAV